MIYFTVEMRDYIPASSPEDPEVEPGINYYYVSLE